MSDNAWLWVDALIGAVCVVGCILTMFVLAGVS